MKKGLLICIAAHYNPERLVYFQTVLNNIFCHYGTTFDIIVDTNIKDFPIGKAYKEHPFIKVKVVSHTDLEHPFHLTYCHRKHFKENIDKYENFLYLEDDLYLPFANYKACLEKYDDLWNYGVPSFVRIEKNADGQDVIVDVVSKHKMSDIFFAQELKGKFYVSFPFPQNYTGFYLIPAKYLKETIKDNFILVSDYREAASSYPTWGLNKKGLVEVYKKNHKWHIHPTCYSYHLPNNYSLSPTSSFAKIKPENIFV